MEQNNSYSSDENDFVQSESRRTYLLTYSQVDVDKFPDCSSFSKCVLQAFQTGKSKSVVKEWACSEELHNNGGKHYHMSINLSGTRRWKPIKNEIYNKHGISVHFQSKNCGYVAAYRYVIKEKPIGNVLHSNGHTDLASIGSPKTKNAMKTFVSNSRKRKSVSEGTENNDNTLKSGSSKSWNMSTKPKRLTNIEVARFMVKNNIKSDKDLMRAGRQRAKDGEPDLESFILNKNPKALADLISQTWKMESAEAAIEREKCSLISLIRIHAGHDCIPTCDRQCKWLKMAKEVLKNNKINVFVFAEALRQAFTRGRAKGVNILLLGETNCGKSFLLEPIELIFKTFTKPATGSYAWIGLDECEVAFINDFRWSPEVIAWSDFLLLLEGATVKLPRPKNLFATDLCIDRTNKIPFFATSKEPIQFSKFNVIDQKETDMMSSRWRTFNFTYQIPAKEMISMEPCPACFCNLVLEGSVEDGNN